MFIFTLKFSFTQDHIFRILHPCTLWASHVAQLVKNLPAMWETWLLSLGWEDPLENRMANPLQYSGLENSIDCIVHGGHKELDTTERRSVLGVHWKDWCWSWNSNTLATSCKELTHWKRPWCWEALWAGGEGVDRGWDGWMASLTRWAWVWVNSGSWW